MKILVLVRDIDIRSQVISALQKEKFEIIQPESAKRAIALVESDPSIDMIIAEPCPQGDERTCVIAFARNTPRLQWTPVIVVKGELDSDTLRSCLNLGVSDVILFPITAEAFLARIRKAAAEGKRRILVVDDEPVILDLLRDFLKLERFSVVTATSAEQAIDILKTTSVHAVISDIGLPGMSGLDLLVRLKESYAELPVILVTGFSGKFTPEHAIAAGADGYFSKPFHNKELIYTLRRILQSSYRGQKSAPARA